MTAYVMRALRVDARREATTLRDHYWRTTARRWRG